MQQNFLVGINYWPARKAMYWWKSFIEDEVRQDFSLLSRYGIQLVRFFLNWEDFQPQPDQIDRNNLNNLVITANLAAEYGLALMPTFFCGHMSGVNWIPDWALAKAEQPGRFPVYSQGNLSNRVIRNFYQDEEVKQAQLFQIKAICGALAGHPAVWAYDLGNESSNCCIPSHRDEGQHWLKDMSSAISEVHPEVPVTLGMHAEDLEENRNLWPQDAARYCDFLSMHGYPFYLSWTEPGDVYVLPFLGIITSWLGGLPVMFQEFGAPSQPVLTADKSVNPEQLKTPLWPEEKVALYYREAVSLLWRAGMTGALGWCFADYHPDLYNLPPLQENHHERYFGLSRWDGSAKPALASLSLWAGKPNQDYYFPTWLRNEKRHCFYDDPRGNLQRLFKIYKRENFQGADL